MNISNAFPRSIMINMSLPWYLMLKHPHSLLVYRFIHYDAGFCLLFLIYFSSILTWDWSSFAHVCASFEFWHQSYYSHSNMCFFSCALEKFKWLWNYWLFKGFMNYPSETMSKLVPWSILYFSIGNLSI